MLCRRGIVKDDGCIGARLDRIPGWNRGELEEGRRNGNDYETASPREREIDDVAKAI
jgi:hypothetical protein